VGSGWCIVVLVGAWGLNTKISTKDRQTIFVTVAIIAIAKKVRAASKRSSLLSIIFRVLMTSKGIGVLFSFIVLLL